LHESQQIGGESTHQIGCSPRFGDEFSLLAGLLPIQGKHFQIAADDRQQILEIMRDACREPSDGFQFLILKTFGFARPAMRVL
jgi:hypothetical protein